MPQRLRKAKSAKAVDLLINLPQFRQANVIMMYMPMPEEVDTTAIAHEAWSQNKVVLVPKIFLKERRMIACEIRSLTEGMDHSYCRILEPTSPQPWPVKDIDFIVIPGLAFDRSGGRLGRGAGFYDRFLTQKGMKAFNCGLAFTEQIFEDLPVFDHDKTVDIVVTDSEIIDPSSNE